MQTTKNITFGLLVLGGILQVAGNNAVLKMEPVGYWPVNEGKGKIVHDLSVNANNAKIYHVPWDKDKKLLDFTGAYQWLEIPKNKVYQTPAFSMGGWFFTRSDVIGSGWVNKQGFLLIGNRHWLNQIGIQLCIRKQETIDVVSDGKEDVLGTRLYAAYKNGKRVEHAYGKPNLAIGQWHHLIYTFEPEKNRQALPGSPNLALKAKVTASNSGGHKSRAPENVIDGNLKTNWIIWPGAGPKPDSQKWIKIDFGKETAVNRVRLFNRPGKTDYFTGGKLLFSDGSSIDVSSLTDEWDGMFATKKVKWIKFSAPQTSSARPGLKEFEVYKENRVIFQEEGVVVNKRRSLGVTGTGKLYLNGKLLVSKDNIFYKPSNTNLQIGNDAYWWHQMAKKSGSLDGSVRDMVWFDRAISAGEAELLCKITKPAVKPEVYGDNMIVLDGRPVGIKDLASLSPSVRRTALLLFDKKNKKTLDKLKKQLVPELEKALNEANCRLVAARLLLKLKDGSVLQNALPELVKVVKDTKKTQSERADAALALAEMGKSAAKAEPTLAGVLNELVPGDNVKPPRVDEILRNALTRALLNIGLQDEASKKVIERTFAKPMLNLLDTKKPGLKSLLHRIKKGRYLEALNIYPKLHHSVREYYLSHKKPQNRDYTATAHFKGATYKVGTGIAWQGVEKVSPDDYNELVSRLSKKYPAAKTWRNPQFKHLYRVPITKITADGKEQKVYLEGEDFILDGHDAKCRAWAIFVDELGYVHLMGGQHNAPNPNYYIPGSWEKMGVSRNRKSEKYPMQMYWVSTKPESIDSFKFAGQRNNPKAIPASYLNYLCLVQSPNNETYLYGRGNAFGFQCWGMYRYSARDKRWSPVGGDPYSITESVRKHTPEWFNYLHDSVRGSYPKKPSNIRRLVWAWQPPFYNFCRDAWGARFDKTGRMHVKMQIAGLDGKGYVHCSSVYAWSDDRGKTFHRADGSAVKLPLTINPAPENNAEYDVDNNLKKHSGGQYLNRQWLELWLGLIKQAGYRI